ncbi:hypothetical protein P8452_30544 [Trifolium repens]|nr:hypothetical protein P8452_30544 [Trifolium repens]
MIKIPREFPTRATQINKISNIIQKPLRISPSFSFLINSICVHVTIAINNGSSFINISGIFCGPGHGVS